MLSDNLRSIIPTTELDIDAIRGSLEQQLKVSEEIIRELAPNAAPSVDPVAWVTTAATRRVVDQIMAALDRLAAGRYGQCNRCGGTILAARLEVLPYAETCIDCQNAVEHS